MILNSLNKNIVDETKTENSSPERIPMPVISNKMMHAHERNQKLLQGVGTKTNTKE